jgi:hypothetical protein
MMDLSTFVPGNAAEVVDLATMASRDLRKKMPCTASEIRKALPTMQSWIPQITTDLDVSLTLGHDNKPKNNCCKVAKSTSNASHASGHSRRGLRAKLSPKFNLKASIKCTFNPKSTAKQTKKAVKHASRTAKRWIRWGRLFITEAFELLESEE